MKIKSNLKEQMTPESRTRFGKAECRDAIYAHVHVHFDLKDRVRILLLGKAKVMAVTYCENSPGALVTESEVTALPIWKTWKQKLFPSKPCFGYAEAKRTEHSLVHGAE